MNRNRVYIVVLIIFFSNINNAFTQRVFKTKSGSEILVFENNKWEFNSIDQIDSNEINPFELPEQLSSNLSSNQVILIDQILSKLKTLEAQAFVDILNYSDQIAQQELKISYFESQKNKENVKLEKDNLDQIKEKRSTSEKEYENYTDKIKEVSSWKVDDIKSLDEKIQKSILELDLNKKTIGSTNNIVKYHSLDEIVLDNRNSYDIDNECEIKYNGPNPNGKGEFVQHHVQSYFNYTPAKIKPFYKEKDFLYSKASVEKINGDYFLILELDFASKDAGKSYGIVKAGEQLQITLLGGYKIMLNAVVNATPRLVENAGNTIYNCVFEIDKSSRKTLQKEYIDKIGVMYSSGYEEYTIYKVDLIMNQINCIEDAE